MSSGYKAIIDNYASSDLTAEEIKEIVNGWRNDTKKPLEYIDKLKKRGVII